MKETVEHQIVLLCRKRGCDYPAVPGGYGRCACHSLAQEETRRAIRDAASDEELNDAHY